jgi:hypothetical protein
MNIDESRWQAAWAFLSLSQIRALFKDLWIPIDDTQKFQEELRKMITPWFEDEKYYHESGPFNYALTDWFEERYGEEALSRLSDWVREIFLYEGSDRLPETVWSAISYRLPLNSQRDFDVPKWVLNRMEKVKKEQQKRRASFEKRVGTSRNQLLIKWDSKIHPFQFSTEASILNRSLLIGTYNIFLNAWERHCSELRYEELFEIWTIGRGLAPHIQMQDLDIVFPSSWRFALQKFLRLQERN